MLQLRQHQRVTASTGHPPHVLQRPAPPLLVRHALPVGRLPEPVQLYKYNRNSLFLHLSGDTFPEGVAGCIAVGPLRTSPIKAEVPVRQGEQIDGWQVIALSVAPLRPQGVYPRRVVDAAPEEMGLRAPLHLHDEPPAIRISAAQVHPRSLVRERHPGDFGGGVFQVRHAPPRG